MTTTYENDAGQIVRFTDDDYTALRCTSPATQLHWWRVYFRDVRDGLSDHKTLASAKIAIKRYQAADKRRRA